MLLLLLGIVFVVGCVSTAGPFITSISSDGKGGLIISKGYVELNGWTGALQNKDAGTTTIKITQLTQ